MKNVRESLQFLEEKIEKEEKVQKWSFQDYLQKASVNPQKFFRDIFALFHDAVMYYVGEGKSEYPIDDPANAALVVYDCSKIFEQGLSHPYFVDRLFANRFVEEVKSLNSGAQQNRIFAFMGAHACGKSIFLNNLLQKLQAYINQGEAFEIFWEIDPVQFSESEEKEKFEISCPSHDHPMLIIPRNHRVEFFEKLLPKSEIKDKIFSQKEYEWIFKQEACTICNSLFEVLYEKLGSIDRVLDMLKVKSYKFNRRLGDGVVVFNPGDPTPMPPRVFHLTHQKIQEKLDKVFGPDRIKYIYSLLAKTNNGIYALMDIKSQNVERFKALHNVVSEGVWRAGEIEERISSLFLALMNPEDKEALEKDETMKSLRGRIRYIDIPYTLDPEVEVKIYESTFGKEIHSYFLPRILESFAKAIIATRMKEKCEPLEKWIGSMGKYAPKHCDTAGRLLRMDIYSGKLPLWLSEEDRRKLDLSHKRNILLFPAREKEGMAGFDGRASIQLFKDFYRLYQSGWKLIRMDNVADYFKNRIDVKQRDQYIPRDFIDPLVNYYDYEVVLEVKEALYFYDEEQIAEDILHFIWASNYKIGERVCCPWTKKEFVVTQEFLKQTVTRSTGQPFLTDYDFNQYVLDIKKKLSLAVMQGDTKEIAKSELYRYLLQNYIKNLKEKTLEPFIDNRNFLSAIQAYGTKDFGTVESKIKDQVERMIGKLMKKFGYTEQGAKEISIYVLKEGPAKKFS